MNRIKEVLEEKATIWEMPMCKTDNNQDWKYECVLQKFRHRCEGINHFK